MLQWQLKIADLDLLDAPLRLGCGLDEVLQLEIRPGDRALARIAGALRKIAGKGDVGSVALLMPLAVGGHIDHRITNQAASEALTEATIGLGFYEDLPYTARPGAAEEVNSLAAAMQPFSLRPAFAQGAAQDIVRSTERKRRFAECYDSQVDGDVARQIASFCEKYGGRERLWVTRAWPAALLESATAANIAQKEVLA